jgi:hypothetical protein
VEHLESDVGRRETPLKFLFIRFHCPTLDRVGMLYMLIFLVLTGDM